MQNKTIEDKQSYRSMAKGTATMGGVQVFNIIINIVRGKLVALFLGAEGMGISSLLSSSIQPIQQFTSLGLWLSIVKNVSSATEQNNGSNKATIIAIARFLLRITAILGAVTAVLLSDYLSEITFGSDDYRWHYRFLAIMVFITTLANGESAILQGCRAIKRLAYSSLVGSLAGLLIGVPLYYFYGVNGIVPAMIALAMANFVFYYYHSHKEVGKINIKFRFSQHSLIAKSMVGLGLISMVAALFGTFTNYGVNATIRFFGGIQDVGLFAAANSITGQYVSLVFTAMSMDYFPRLSAVSTDNQKVSRIVNQQTEIVLLTIAPIIGVVLTITPLIIQVLLTSEFLSVVNVVRVMALGVFFQALNYPMGYISFSKGDKRTYFWLEGVYGNIQHFILYALSYYIWGVIGLGIGYLINYVISVFLHYVVARKFYEFRISRTVILLSIFLAIMLSISLCISQIENTYLSTSLLVVMLIIISLFSFKQLNRRLDIILLIKSKFIR